MRFKFRESVRIKNGFYEGYTGTAVKEISARDLGSVLEDYTYVIQLDEIDPIQTTMENINNLERVRR